MRSTVAPMSFTGRRRRLIAALLTLVLSLGMVVSVPAPAFAATCPCTIWATDQVPANPAENDTDAVEVGVKFRSDAAGSITGIRFYKGTGNTGTHTGSLWSSAGTRLATATFTGETATGWQQATFAAPVAITASTTYIASYYAPNGRYASDENYFTGRAVANSPLTALADGTDGGNGVYRYGTGGGFPNSTYRATNYWVDAVFTPAGPPPPDTTEPTLTSRQPAAGATNVATNSGISAVFSESVQPATIAISLSTPAGAVSTSTVAYQDATRTASVTPTAALAASTTYTAKVSGAKDAAGNTMTDATWTFTTAAAPPSDTTKPTISNQQPAAGATNVAANTTVSAVFSEAIQQPTMAFSITGPAGVVAATQAYNATSRTVTLTPGAPLSNSTIFTVSLSGTKDTAGNTMDPVTWTFTTAAATPSGCPCTIWQNTTVPTTPSTNDSSAVEVGVKFRADRAGYITGLRFYKGTGNTGTHVGSLWTAAGAKLSSVTFVGETATGWQQAMLSSPIPVSANTTYVASYYAPVGRYSSANSAFASAAVTRGPLTALRNGTDGGNGVYRYGATGFPTTTFQSSNYYVDVVFDVTAVDTTAPTVAAQTPAANSSGVPTTTTVTASFSEPVVSGSAQVELKTGSTVVPAALAYDAASQTATLTPNAELVNSTVYTVTVSGAKDAGGNTMAPVTWSFTTAAPAPPPPSQGPGGPIAVITSSSNPYSVFLTEILRTEGLNEFATVDTSQISATTLAGYDVIVIGNVSVNAAQAAVLTDWVNGGGNLIAMRPSGTLSGLLGITAAAGTTADAYLKVDPSTAPGAGIVSETIQYHGTADRYALTGAQAIAMLYSNATTATTFPAVTLRSVGSNGGQTAAFTYDLARSVALSRQGNPAWAGQERDGTSPIRSDDMFFGNGSTDWVNLNKVQIPQADEQQRLLANLVQVMNRDKKPLPRFWYFPRNLKAVVIATGDDHGNNGTAGRFDRYLANSPAGCSVADWTCLRFSSYLFPTTPLSNTAAVNYTNQGFEVGVHVQNGCSDFTAASLASSYASDLAAWRARFPGLPNPSTNRYHCIAYSDWASQPKTELANGMRLDGNYYYWPGSWVQDRPGFMTGSGMPMRFTDTDGSMIDVYQATSQMTDESDQSYPLTPNTLLDNALGPLGYYGAFNANMHTDNASIFQDEQLMASAKARGVPMVSGKQMLNWLDGRNASTMGSINWNNNALNFVVAVGAGANGLTGMLPTAGPNGTVMTGLTRGGTPVATTKSTVKGLEYASFSAAAGSYTATYGSSGTAAITSLKATPAPDESASSASIDWRTSEPATSEIALGTTPDALSTTQTVSGSSSDHSLDITDLEEGTTYYYRVTSTDNAGNEQTYPAADAPPATFTTPAADTTAPQIGDPVVSALPDGSAQISWATNELADSLVRIGDSADSLVDQPLDPAQVTQHRIVVTGLDPNKTYSVNTTSADASGNEATSGTIQFTTPGRGLAEQTDTAFRSGTLAGQAAIGPDAFGNITLVNDIAGAATKRRAGTFESAVLDAQAMVDWDRLIVRADVPDGSKLVVKVRTGSTTAPDGTWSGWRTVADGEVIGKSSRYLQYRVELSSSAGSAAPAVYGIGFVNNAAPLDPPKETG